MSQFYLNGAIFEILNGPLLIEGKVLLSVEEIPLEEMRAKLPNIRCAHILFDNHNENSNQRIAEVEWVVEFCRTYPLLFELDLSFAAFGTSTVLVDENFISAISSLQHLRSFRCYACLDEEIRPLIQRLSNLEELDIRLRELSDEVAWPGFEICTVGPSSQTMMCISRMSKLKCLSVSIEAVI